MAKLNAKKTLTAVVIAAATFATPALAHAQNYSTTSYNNDCATNTNEQVLAGAIGAVLGGVFGSQVSGNGARTEGSVLGAVLGGAAGAAIADGNNDCDKIRKNQTYSTTSSSGAYNTGYNNQAPIVRTSNRTVFGTTSNRGYTPVASRGYGYDDRIVRIDRRIDYLRSERDELKRALRYTNSRHEANRIDKRLYDIDCELDELKDRRKLVKKVVKRQARSY